MDYTVTLTNTEDQALSFVALSQQDWIDNVVKNRARIAVDEIVKIAVEQYIAAGESMPGSKDEIVATAFERGWVKTAAARNAEAEAAREEMA
ncbi:MAG: hypothetical protein VW270_00225 [Candidatus Poseidoniales archaeon]